MAYGRPNRANDLIYFIISSLYTQFHRIETAKLLCATAFWCVTEPMFQSLGRISHEMICRGSPKNNNARPTKTTKGDKPNKLGRPINQTCIWWCSDLLSFRGLLVVPSNVERGSGVGLPTNVSTDGNHVSQGIVRFSCTTKSSDIGCRNDTKQNKCEPLNALFGFLVYGYLHCLLWGGYCCCMNIAFVANMCVSVLWRPSSYMSSNCQVRSPNHGSWKEVRPQLPCKHTEKRCMKLLDTVVKRWPPTIHHGQNCRPKPMEKNRVHTTIR